MKAFLLACVAAVISRSLASLYSTAFRSPLTKHSRLPPCVLVSELCARPGKVNFKTLANGAPQCSTRPYGRC